VPFVPEELLPKLPGGRGPRNAKIHNQENNGFVDLARLMGSKKEWNGCLNWKNFNKKGMEEAKG